MALLRIAYRGFMKYRKRRNNLTVVLSGAFFLVFFFISFFATIHQNLWRYWIQDFIGGDLIVSRNLDQQFDIFTPVPPSHYFDYQQFLKNNHAFAGKVSPHLRFAALLENKITNDSTVSIVIGLDPEKDAALGHQLRISEGRPFKPDQKEIVLSETAASNINAKIGDQIIIYAKTKDGYLNYDLFKITGYFDLSSAASLLGQKIAFLPLAKTRELLMADSGVSELLYTGTKGSIFAGLNQRRLYQKVSGLDSFSFVRSLSLAFRFLALVIFLLIFAFAISSIYHNVTLMNEERMGEIGVYLTYGAKPLWIRKLFLLELTIYTMYCALLGSIVSWLALVFLNSLGIYSIDIATEVIMSTTHFIFRIDFRMFLGSFFILWGLVILGSLRPVWKSSGSRRVVGLFGTLKR